MREIKIDMNRETCHWCGEKLGKAKPEKRANARGYGYYVTCPSCEEENVLLEIDFTR